MALTDFLALTDDKLKAKYETKKPSLASARAPFIKSLNTAKDQFANDRRAPKAMWSRNDDVVRLALIYKGNPVSVSGKKEFHIPAERFTDSLNALIASVEAGELDEALHAASQGTSGEASKTGTAKPKGEKFPKAQRPDWEKLTRGQKQDIGRMWSEGKNPDGSLRADGEKPTAKFGGRK